MKIEKVIGNDNRHRVMLYALSTCAWCKKTKKYFKDKNIEFQYVDVDLCSEEDLKEIRGDFQKRGLQMVFPTVIVDDKNTVVGYREEKLNEALA
jgi:glutaredoxin